jgi:hypothetical protein
LRGADGAATVNQADLQQLAEERIKDAKALLDGGRWSFAYYTAGYAVECALKSALLARMIHTGWVFQEKAKVQDCLTHEFGELVKLAGLTDELNNQLKASAAFAGNWGRATSWKVTSRYESKPEADAKALYAAITDEPEGVMRWIRNYW